VLIAAGEVGQTADTLRVEVNDFLSAMKQTGTDDRRSYERVPGGGLTARLTIKGADVHAAVRDISRGGIALLCTTTAPPGAEVKVALPIGGSISGRVVRCEGGLVTVAFNQGAANIALLDRTLDDIRQRAVPAAA
jgi:hypothetical protein